MVGASVHTVTLLFAVIMGTAAAILSVLTLEVLWRSPFGKAVVVISIVLGLFVVYHALLLVQPGRALIDGWFTSVMYGGVAVSVWLIVWNQHRIRRRQGGEP